MLRRPLSLPDAPHTLVTDSLIGINSIILPATLMTVAILLGLVPPAFFLTVIPQAVVEMVAAAVITPIVVVAVNSIPNARGN